MNQKTYFNLIMKKSKLSVIYPEDHRIYSKGKHLVIQYLCTIYLLIKYLKHLNIKVKDNSLVIVM